VARSIFVGRTRAEARAYAHSVAGPYGQYYRSLMRKLIGNGRPELFKGDPAMADAAITLEYVLESLVICGTADEVSDAILALRERVGDFGTLVYAGHDWADADAARRSMRSMAEEVMPRVNASLGA
jgi:alkanesulfonate monooxygenase SsuD/methylene tetrahydromethanopterin reductase-like flavin-dependent oxidoreductase (luciferase family)